MQRYLRENVKEAGKANSVRISSALLQGLDGNSRMETFLMENAPDELKAMGIEIKDTREGVKWQRI